MVLAVLLGVVSSVQGQSTERDRVLRLLGESYQRVTDAKIILFEFDRFHVIRPKFDNRKKLIELALEPKYYFEDDHPDWAEPDDFANLSRAEFIELSTKLKNIKDLGKIVQSVNTISAVTNMTAWYAEYYRNASFTWGVVVDLRKGDDPPYEVRWFRFKYGANADKPRKHGKSIKFDLPSTSAPPTVPKSQPKP
ncbi:MAG: hypothetical protein KA447_04510 [Pyrinomonadaceae bacterium]|nr:hypothetical protein [Pyrinomonadaceae bacterium]